MHPRISNRRPVGQAARAFSLVELLTAVSIMVVIIFALYAMFNQTQKALRASITQVDVLESGRTTAEMLGRELSQLGASKAPHTINLYVGMTPVPPLVQLDVNEKTVLRTNLLQEFFFLRQDANSWVGTGYRVLGAESGVGTLYRYTVSTNYRVLNYTNLMGQFMHAVPVTNTVTGTLSTNFDRVTEGIVHLRLTAYDPDGRRMGWETTNISSAYRILRMNRSGTKLGLYSTAANVADAQVVLQQSRSSALTSAETQFSFVSNALPAYVELELGVLEQAAYKQYQGIASPGTAASARNAQAYLSKQAAKVHLFRQRIPIRTALQ